MDRKHLHENILRKKSFLCVGLDTDLTKIPAHLRGEERPIFAFNRAIVDATAPYCVAYKPNMAFYEGAGIEGLRQLSETVSYIRQTYPDMFIISDAKRGDIGNSSEMYARSVFDCGDFDAVTASPYMGEDSVTPFFRAGKWAIVLALTSNGGSRDFQMMVSLDGERLFERVLRISRRWGNEDNMMYVVGATHGKLFASVRRIVPDHFLLVPGLGAQSGSLGEVVEYGMNSKCGLLVNSSRGIIYADRTERFAEVAGEEAWKVRCEMAKFLN
ncbi:MAG: orotidine-5'-phosphate decarboxylase [Dysgonamonadaceae bacterium]|jgi:orotidine-5'-phosphate decarboxylase|nr:orotidine-5'-phosphate decarboxylase [Dysgonamonadaceae bacterium]